ncbi:VanZ family protein [Leucobacter sp. HY1910]
MWLRVTLFLTLLAAWMGLIFAFSAQPGDASDVPSDAIAGYVQGAGASLQLDTITLLVRKGAHAAAYFVLGLLAFETLRSVALTRLRSALSLPTVAVLSLVFVTAYAISDEVHQLFVPGRSGEVRDVAIDVASGAAAIALLLALRCAGTRRAAGAARG